MDVLLKCSSGEAVEWETVECGSGGSVVVGECRSGQLVSFWTTAEAGALVFSAESRAGEGSAEGIVEGSGAEE